MTTTPKLICTRAQCADPFCDREHPEASDGDVVLGDDCVFYALCASCGLTVPETEAVPTKGGLVMHEECAERRYPVIDNGDNRWPR